MSNGAEDKEKGSSFVGYALKHPLRVIRLINRTNLRVFFNTAHYSGFRVAFGVATNVVGNYLDDVRRTNNLQSYLVDLESVPDKMEIPYSEDPTVSIVIPVYNQYQFTRACINSIIQNTRGVSYEVILGDDCSKDETVNIGSNVKNLVYVRNETNLGFLRNCNNASQKARGKYILFLNNDTLVMEDWLKPLVDLAESSEDIGAVGSKLVYPDGLLQEAGGIIWSNGTACNYGKGSNPNNPEYNYVKEVDYISGASLMVRKDLFQQIGGFDTRYAPAYCEDSDLCFEVRKLGYKVKYQPRSVVIHFEGMTHKNVSAVAVNDYQSENNRKFEEKWKPVLRENSCRPGTEVFNARDRSMGKKTVLVISAHTPTSDLDSDSGVILNYLRILVDMGYNVKVATNDFNHDPLYSVSLQELGIEVLSGVRYRDNWRDMVKNHKKNIDHVLIVGFDTAELFIAYMSKYSRAKVHYFLLNNNLVSLEREYDFTHDTHTLLEISRNKKSNPQFMKNADTCITVCNCDSEYVVNTNRKCRVVQIPYGTYTPRKKQYTGEARIVFAGFLDTRPNHDGLKWFLSEVMPLLRIKVSGVKLEIIGARFTDELICYEAGDVLFRGHLSNDEIERVFSESSAFISPMRISAGFRANAFEAMSRGLPIVSTTLGLEAFDGLKAEYPACDDPVSFANEIARIIDDREYSEKLCGMIDRYLSETMVREKLEAKFRKIFD